MELELERREEVHDGLLDHWLTTIRIAGSEPLVLRSASRCGPEGAEVPWSFVNITGLADVDVGWRWPVELEVGAEFEGVVTMRMFGREHRARRRHTVGEVERVIVPAGSYEATRVEFVDSADQGELRGTVWVRESIGLIRSEREVRPGERVVLELSSVEP